MRPKAGFAFGCLAAGLVFGMFGFIESTTGDIVQPQSAILAISYTISLFVAVAIAISLVILRAYTIDERALIRKIEAHSLAENKI